MYTDTCWVNFYNAIWTNAVVDDFSEQKFRLFTELTEAYFNKLLKYKKEKRQSNADVRRKVLLEYGENATFELTLFDIIVSTIKSNEEELKDAIRNKIYKESSKWPKNRREKDFEFEETYLHIKKIIISSIDFQTQK